jgi:hypothetical protein
MSLRMGAWRFGDCVDGNRHWNLRASPLVGITCLAETVTTNLGLSGLLMDRVQRTLPPLIVFPDRNPTRMRRQRHCEIATHRSKPISVVRHPRITSLAEMQIVSLYKTFLRDASLGGPWRLIAKNTSSVTLPVFQKELYREVDGQSVCEMHHNSFWEALGEDNAGIVGSAHAAVLFYLPGSRSQQQAEQPYIAKIN